MAEIGNSASVHVDGEGIAEQQQEMESEASLTERVLDNPVILDEIFDHLPKYCWKSARLVNKTWHSCLQHRWRDQMNYRLGLGGYCNSTFKHKTFTAQFMEEQLPANNSSDPLQLALHPIRNIQVRWNLEDKICLQPDLTRFWELFGHGLKSLKLVYVRICEGALLKKLLFELTPSLEEFRYQDCVCEDMDRLELTLVKLNIGVEYLPPATLQKNLKVVHLETLASHQTEEDSDSDGDDDDYYDAYKPRFPISWIEFFSAFPNIQKLVLDIDPLETERPSDLVKLFEAIKVIRKANENEVLNITELHAGETGFAHFDVTENVSLVSSLPISILQMNVVNTSYDDTVLLFQSLESTLRNLKLVLDAEIDLGKGDLPKDVFPQGLTKLSLEGPIVSSFEFLMHLPNLEELDVQNIPCILPLEINIAVVTPLVNLKKLKYTLLNYFPATQKQVEGVAKLMSNVKTCECVVNDFGFLTLCLGLPNLEHLVAELMFEEEQFLVENLIKLKCLKSLKIESWDFKITDKSVFEGFLKIPSLDKVTLPSFYQRITEEGLQAMAGKLITLT